MKRMPIVVGCVVCVLLCAPRGARAAGENPVPAVFVEKNVPIPMRDGTILRADIRRPSEKGKFPVLIFRTPYDKAEGDECNESTFAAAVKRGYAMIVQDVRGRFASDGEFVPYLNEGKDGYDTIEWAAAQPWSTGDVGMFGLSYPGAVQWLAALENPPHLRAVVPAMCFSTLREFIYFGGVFESAWASWTYKNMTPDLRVKKNLPGPRTYAEAKAEWDNLGGADVLAGWVPSLEMPYFKDVAPFHYDWLKHQPYERWWDWGDFEGKYGRAKAAVLNLSGWYDESYGTQGAIANYLGLLKSRRGAADPRTRLIIGPWVHGVDATGAAVAGDRKFSDAARIDYDQVVLDWLDRYVRGLSNGVSGWSNVRVFSMGKDRWIDSDVWPLRGLQEKPLFLAPPDPAGERGALADQPPGKDGECSFVSDPAHPVRDEFETSFGAFDLRSLSTRNDVLTFETAPFESDVEVIGRVAAEMYVSSTNAPDFDLYVKLLDVAPDGTAFNLESAGHEVLRVSYRDKTAKRKLLKPGEVVTLTYENMITGNTFMKGHRLRVCLMGSWFPTYARNPQNGELETTSKELRTGTIDVHYGPEYPSQLILPILPAGK